jgi:hypothetical protein
MIMDNVFEKAMADYNWKKLPYASGQLKSVKNLIPNTPGVYILRAPKAIHRVDGCSNVIYIGKAGSLKDTKQGLQGRLFNTRGAAEKWVRDHIEAKFTTGEFILQFTEIKGEDPKMIEERLLKAYLENHGELPPANHQSVKIE